MKDNNPIQPTRAAAVSGQVFFKADSSPTETPGLAHEWVNLGACVIETGDLVVAKTVVAGESHERRS